MAYSSPHDDSDDSDDSEVVDSPEEEDGYSEGAPGSAVADSDPATVICNCLATAPCRWGRHG